MPAVRPSIFRKSRKPSPPGRRARQNRCKPMSGVFKWLVLLLVVAGVTAAYLGEGA